MKTKSIIFILSLLFAANSFGQAFEYYGDALIESKYVIVKFKQKSNLKNNVTNTFNPNDEQLLYSYLHSIQAEPLRQKYTNAYLPDSCTNCVDISRIYDFRYTADISIERVLAYINSLAFIEYAEPNYVEELLYIPNDPEFVSQWHLNTARIYEAWDIEQGDTNVVIGITDAGFAISNPDLVNKIKYNYADPINGKDDDHDGYTDNFRGWDFGNNDNNPDVGDSDHGTWVAGIASAEVNNAYGIAGVGNKTKFLPIKIATNAGAITRGYEGIVYAADQKCNIINCSWGSVGSYSKYGEDIINYATFNRNALVVAAAGNNNNQGIFYPASYKNALSVGGTLSSDEKWGNPSAGGSGSNWNYYVDVAAPSAGFKSITKNNTFITLSGGTSFAAPIVSGIAALIKSKYPSLTALEIGERIRATTDDIYNITSNQAYIDLLGSGRVNAYEALTNTTKPSIRISHMQTTNKNGQYMFYPGDTMLVSITFKNYLASVSNVYITISCETSIIAPISGNILIPQFESGEEITISQPFVLKIAGTLPSDFATHFKLSYAAVNYYGYEYVPVSFNPSYYNFEIGNIKATATANSTIGILNPALRKEYGFIYNTYPNMIYEGGILIGQSENLVQAQVRNHTDFSIIQFPKILTADSVDLLLRSRFQNNATKLSFNQYIYAWNSKDALIHEYRIKNNTDSTIHNLRVGAYIDWQIINQFYNKISYVDSLQLAIISTIDPLGFYAGIMPLHYHASHIYAVDDVTGKDSILISNGFTKSEMWYALTKSKKYAGQFIDGGNVASISTARIGSIPSQDSALVRYAFLAAPSSKELVALARELKKSYITDTTTHIPQSLQTISNSNKFAEVHQTKQKITLAYPETTNILGIQVISIDGKIVLHDSISRSEQKGKYTIHTSKFAPGVYSVVLQNGTSIETHKIIVSP